MFHRFEFGLLLFIEIVLTLHNWTDLELTMFDFEDDDDTPSTEYLDLMEADYKGKKVELNKPFRTPGAKKKFAVYVKNDAGRVVIVRFGDQKLSIKRNDPERRKSFRARHSCDTAKDKTTPRYWSCRFWEVNQSVSDLQK